MGDKIPNNVDPLLYAMQLINIEPYELSYEKIVNQRDWFKALAKEAIEKYYENN